MHLSFLVSNFPINDEKNVGGIETSVKNLSAELIKNNFEVSVFVYGQDKEEDLQIDNINVYTIKNQKTLFFPWFFFRKHIKKRIDNVHKKNRIDAIEVADWSGVSAFMKFNFKTVIRLHGTDRYFCKLENRKQRIKNYILEKTALKNANYILSVSNFTAKKTKEIFNLKNKITIIHNGIDTSFFKNNSKITQVNSILYFGTLLRKKGVLELAHIFNEVVQLNPKAKLTLLGRDNKDIFENESTLKLFKTKLNANSLRNFQHIKSIPYKKVKNFIQDFSVIVFPSFAEAFPMSWLEAMSMNKALVTSNIGWANEIMVDGKTGYMVNPKNHKEYAEKIVELLDNEEKARLFGENARKYVLSNFSLKIIGEKNIEFYKSLK
ncbi:glycosyltransferase family 4 protein [uncultured Polaribacter sp.]|uniref:glycosyltransferase family 4 protein n=1 Tax=uncultured Polaribacter sp. TaxID=174711 RepID=UPI00262172A6|nr:glycosyltransferase family 4 protein [uncultured Polaribacter sp.]